STINPRAAMPRLSETDSSIGGYEDGDEEENRDSSLNLTAIAGLQPKERVVVNGDKISPSSLRHRDSSNRLHHQNQRTHPLRRSPGSEGNNKKLVSNNSSSSSSSSSSSCTGRIGSAQAFRRMPEPAPHGYHTWDGRNRVRRSRSLQLPETKSPGALSPSSHSHTDVIVKIGSEPAERPRRPFIQQRKVQSEESRFEDGLRWEDEARAVTDYLHGTRSRAAARALLQARYHAEHELERRGSKEQEPAFNIFFVSRNKNKQQQQQQLQQRQRVLQRGATTPTTAAGHVLCMEMNPCNPDTCDFWPHCAHRDTLYPPSSHTPSQNHRGRNESRRNYDNDEKGKRGEISRGGAQSTRSSPASLERVDEYDHTMPRKNQNEKKSRWRSSQQGQYSQIPRRPATFGSSSERLLKSSLESASSAGSAGVVSPLLDLVDDEFDRPLSVTKERKVSPVIASVVNSRSPSAVGGTSSSSSSSSDVWVTTSDRTVTKSPRTQKSSGTSTPLEDASSTGMLMTKSPVRDRDKSVLEPRPGSAPTERQDDRNKVMLDSQQRSLSLPKSFLSERGVVPVVKAPKHR
ncbi:hypothetical protein L9F63_002483, partial [Diploptera punctata]